MVIVGSGFSSKQAQVSAKDSDDDDDDDNEPAPKPATRPVLKPTTRPISKPVAGPAYKPVANKQQVETNDNDDEMIGPPLPPGFEINPPTTDSEDDVTSRGGVDDGGLQLEDDAAGDGEGDSDEDDDEGVEESESDAFDTSSPFLTSSLAAYVRKTAAVESVEEVDPREALLKYAKEAAENPHWIAPAYKDTQPKPIFQAEDEEQED
eukprot:Em0008g846a